MTTKIAQDQVQGTPKSVFNYMTQAEIDSVVARDGSADVTTACQTFIDAVGNGTGTFPDGRYYVESIDFKNLGGVFYFDNAAFMGIGTAAEVAVVKYTGRNTYFIGTLTINGQLNSNYTAGLNWRTTLGSSEKSQYGVFDNLKIQGTLIGLLYGALDGVTIDVDGHSENHINNIQMQDVQQAIYHNGGVLLIHGGTLTVAPGSWGGAYTAANARIVEKYQGSLELDGVHCNMTTITDGIGFENKDGTLLIRGGNWEISSKEVELSGGKTMISGIGSQIQSTGTKPFCELVNATSGSFTLNGLNWQKASGTAASDQALIEANSAVDWDVNLTDVLCNNENRNSLIKSTYQNNTWLPNITMSNVRTRAPAGDGDYSTTPYNLLDTLVTRPAALDNLWYENKTSGTSTATLDTVEKPTVAGRTYTHSIKLDCSATGVSAVTNCDRTSAATIKTTGMRVMSGKNYFVEAWVKQETGGTGNVKLNGFFADGAGAVLAGFTISDETQFVGTTWTYITGVVAATTNAGFMAAGIAVTNDIGYFIDLKVSRTD